MEGDRSCFWLFLILVLNLINPAVSLDFVAGTYNITEAIGIKGTDDATKADVDGTYNDTDITDIKGTYNATDINDVRGTYNTSDSNDVQETYNTTDINDLKGTYNTTDDNDVKGTYNTTEVIRIFPRIQILKKDDTPVSESPLKPKIIQLQILPNPRRNIEHISTQNIKNMDVVEPTEKHLEGTAIKKTNDVVNVADIERDYPVPVKYYEYGTNSEPLTHANNFIRDWPLPIDFPSTTQTPDRLFPNPDYNVPKVIGSTDRVMVLEPRKDFSSCDANDVKSKLQNVWLKKWTENYVYSLKKKNEHMPIVDSDNMLWSKFSRAVIENFLLTFYRTYLQDISLSEWSLAEFLDVNAYNNSFYTALKHLRDRKGQTALEFAAEPRRHSDICKAIIAKPIDIVQSHCTTNMPTWVCNVKYLAELTDESKSCSSIWIHALIHLKTIEVNARIDPGDIIVDELEATIYTQPSSDANLLFDFIIDTIESLRIPLKEPLKTNTKLYRDIKDYEEKDLLRCLEID